MQNGRMTNMNARQARPAAPFAGRSARWSSNGARPQAKGLTTREAAMSGISHWPKAKPGPVIPSRQRTTTSTPNIISG